MSKFKCRRKFENYRNVFPEYEIRPPLFGSIFTIKKQIKIHTNFNRVTFFFFYPERYFFETGKSRRREIYARRYTATTIYNNNSVARRIHHTINKRHTEIGDRGTIRFMALGIIIYQNYYLFSGVFGVRNIIEKKKYILKNISDEEYYTANVRNRYRIWLLIAHTNVSRIQ